MFTKRKGQYLPVMVLSVIHFVNRHSDTVMSQHEAARPIVNQPCLRETFLMFTFKPPQLTHWLCKPLHTISRGIIVEVELF